MSLKIGASARKERGLLPEEKAVTATEPVAKEPKEAVAKKSAADKVIEQLDGVKLMGIQKNADGTRSIVELNVVNGKPVLDVSKPVDLREAAYQFKIAIAHKVLKG